MSRNITNLFARVLWHAERDPSRTAVEINACRYSYEWFSGFVTRLGNALLHHDDALIGILARRSIAAYGGVFASQYAGRGYVPLNPIFPADRNRYLLQNSHVRSLVVGKECLNSLKSLLEQMPDRCMILCEEIPEWRDQFPHHQWNSFDSCHDDRINYSRRNALDLAYVLYTSGTSGQPKGVPISQGNLESFLHAMEAIVQPRSSDRVAQLYELTFDPSVQNIFLSITSGSTLVCMSAADRMFADKYLINRQISVFVTPPSVFRHMQAVNSLRPNKFPDLRFVALGGEALHFDLARAIQLSAPNAAVENHYGPTEATVAITRHRLLDADASLSGSVPIGKVFPGHRYKLEECESDDDRHGHRAGKKGVLWVSGPQVSSGYLSSAQNKNRFINDQSLIWYNTGDTVREDSAGVLYFVGREDFQVKIQGRRIELEEIEATIKAHAAGTNVLAVAWPQQHPTSILLVLEGKNAENEYTEIKSICKRNLPPYMVPKHVWFVESLPLSENLKIDRKKVVELLQATPEDSLRVL